MKAYMVDAFTTNRFEGNRAGVVLEADQLSAKERQQLAYEIGASETAFVSHSKNADFNVEFYTPKSQIDFCGHATIATFYMMAELGKLNIDSGICNITQETKAGILPVAIEKKNGRTFVTMTQRAPEFRSPQVSTKEVAHALNIQEVDLHQTLPLGLSNTGNWHLMVPVQSKHTLDGISYDAERLSKILTNCGAATAHVFFADSPKLFYARNFCPTIGIPEDPATGAAAGAFGAYLTHNGYLSEKLNEFEIVQGEAMGKKSSIFVRIRMHEGEIDLVQVAGTAAIHLP
ncbi:MAG: PhzF family phenazine biosynthesis isomerase [Candidatus Obscuribacterales bacterium]|nr:PhzF family phenazine biosynthesis isomerase [Candidatus Obscuribacterales bacterium]